MIWFMPQWQAFRGSFSWEEWGVQKAISLVISIATFGVGKLVSLGKMANKAAKLGQLSHSAAFTRQLASAAVQVINTVMTN